jgi:hypothetical protein
LPDMTQALNDPKLGIRVIAVRNPVECEIAHLDGVPMLPSNEVRSCFAGFDLNQQISVSAQPELLHRADLFCCASVNKVFGAPRATLISLGARSCSPIVHVSFWRITLFTRFRCRLRERVYAVPSSLKELSRAAVIAR